MEIDVLKQELMNMESRLTDLEEKIDDMNVKLTQVVDAILGNPLTHSGGFKHDVETINQRIVYLEKKQREFDEFKKRIYWTVGLIVIIVSAVQYLTNIYSNIKH